MDDVLVNLGDAFETEARFVRALKLPEAGKARLEKIYDDQAYAAYSKVVLEHPAAAHVEDARDRIVGMGLPIPTPTPEQVAASAALENSRGQYTLSNRVEFFVLHKADTVPAATLGEPPLEDAKPTLAPTVTRQAIVDFNTAMNPAAFPPRTLCACCPARSLHHRLVCPRAGACRQRRAARASGRARRRRWRNRRLLRRGLQRKRSNPGNRLRRKLRGHRDRSALLGFACANRRSVLASGLSRLGVPRPRAVRTRQRPSPTGPQRQHGRDKARRPAHRDSYGPDREARRRSRRRQRSDSRIAAARATCPGRRQEAQARLRQIRRVLQQAQEEEGPRQTESLLGSLWGVCRFAPGCYRMVRRRGHIGFQDRVCKT